MLPMIASAAVAYVPAARAEISDRNLEPEGKVIPKTFEFTEERYRSSYCGWCFGGRVGFGYQGWDAYRFMRALGVDSVCDVAQHRWDRADHHFSLVVGKHLLKADRVGALEGTR